MHFDEYITVDWSSASSPQIGPNSIWICTLIWRPEAPQKSTLHNIPTRSAATEWLRGHLYSSSQAGNRILVGFDFPFGYPTGTASALGMQGPQWRNIWQLLFEGLSDNPNNENNRFDLAEYLNQQITGEAFPFWGNVRDEKRKYLLRRGRRPHEQNDVAERRLVEQLVPSAQPVWKLAGVGSAGSQALTGIPAVWSLRFDPHLAAKTRIWPFETGLRIEPSAQIIMAEIYPSIFPLHLIKGKPKDAAQVTSAARALAIADINDQIDSFFGGLSDLNKRDKTVIENEEAWILGVSDHFKK